MYSADLKLLGSFEVLDNPKSVVTLTVLAGQDAGRCHAEITAKVSDSCISGVQEPSVFCFVPLDSRQGHLL